MKTTIAALLGAAGLAVAAPALAQPYNPPPRDAAVAGHDLRGQLEALEQRIRDGVRTGQLDQRESDRALRDLDSIRNEEGRLRERSGGQLDEIDRGRLQQRLDQLSRSIHWMREHGSVPAPLPGPMPPPVAVPGPGPGGEWSLDRREDWLQQRIERGRADGSLDRREAFRAQRELTNIRSMQAHLTRRDGGRLSGHDETYLDQRLDQLRNQLHWQRNNGEAPPWARP